MNETENPVSDGKPDLRFFDKELDYIACISELLSSCIVIRDSCIDAISYETGALVCRIVPELTSQKSGTLRKQYSHFHLSDGPNCFWLLALRTLESGSFEVHVWDLTTASLYRKFSLFSSDNLLGKTVLFEFYEDVFELVSITEKRLNMYRSQTNLQNLANQSSVEVRKLMERNDSFDLSNPFICKKLTAHEVFGIDSESLIFADFNEKEHFKFQKLGAVGGLTTLCVNKEKRMAAVGTKAGKIILVHNLCLNYSKWVLTFVHWHTLPVLSLAFNTEGSMLYSGGSENVLVFWPVQDTASRDFVPRLPAPIKFIHAVEKSGEILCALEDNSLITISTSRDVDKQFAFFVKQTLQVVGKQPEMRNVVKTFSNQIVAKSHPGMIQFSKPDSAAVTMEFDVCQFSYVAERIPKPHWNILAFDINESGHMCTLEHCQVQSLEQAVLKFWVFNETQFDLDISVHGIKFHNDCLESEIVARCGIENEEFVVLTDEIRVWTYANGSYRLKLTFPRNKFNYLFPNCLCFSVDGSLLLGNYEKFLMAWNCFEKYSPSAKIILPASCKEIILGRNHLTAKLFLVSYHFEDGRQKCCKSKAVTEIRSLPGSDVVWSCEMKLAQLGTVSTLPAFLAFCEDTNSVVILLARMTNVFRPLEFSLFQYPVDSTYSCIRPVILPVYDPCQYQTVGNREANGKLNDFMDGHKLVIITDESKLLVLESKDANQPFSLLQTSQFEVEKEAKTRVGDLLNEREASVVEKMKASQSLHKFVTEELYEYPSLLLPPVDEICDKLFSFSIDGYKIVSTFD